MADALIRLPIRAASRTASRVPSTGYGDSGPQIVLSNASQLEGTSTGTTFGNLSVIGGSGTWTFTKTADTDSAFTLTSAALKNAVVFNYEVKSSYAVTIEATNGTLTISRTFTINVTNVLEVTLGALTIDDDDAVPGEPWSATISGKSSGSTITATSSDGTVLTVVGTTVSGTFAAEGTPGYSLSEAHPDATNSPRVSIGTITVAEVTIGAPDLFTILMWDVEDAGVGNAVQGNIGALPDLNGGTLTDIQLRINGDTILSTGRTGVGPFIITDAIELPDDVAADFEIRPVTEYEWPDDDAGWSDVKSVTPTLVEYALSAPILNWTSSAGDLTPEFTVDVDDDALSTDVLRVQLAGSSDFAAISQETTPTLADLDATLGLSAVAEGTWYIRAIWERPIGTPVSTWSNVEWKTVSAIGAPDAFTIGKWTAVNATTGNAVQIDVGALPDLHGGTLADIELRINEDTILSTGLTGLGGYLAEDETLLPDDVEAEFEIRPVITEYSWPDDDTGWSDVKTATPTFGVGAVATVTLVDKGYVSGTTSFTFADKVLGDKVIIIAIVAGLAGVLVNTTFTVTANDVPAVAQSPVARVNGVEQGQVFSVEPGTSLGDVVVTTTHSGSRCLIAIFDADDLVSLTATDSYATPSGAGLISSSCDIEAGGFVVGMMYTSANTTPSPSGIDTDYSEHGVTPGIAWGTWFIGSKEYASASPGQVLSVATIPVGVALFLGAAFR